MIDLPELLALIQTAWPDHYARGRILHVHKNAVTLKDGSVVHLRILVQKLSDGEASYYADANKGEDTTYDI